MPDFDRLIRISVRVVTGLLGLGLLGYSIFHAGPALVWKQIHAVGWGLGVITVARAGNPGGLLHSAVYGKQRCRWAAHFCWKA